MRVKNDWRSSSVENYKDFCKKNPSANISFTDWKKIIQSFNHKFLEHILETGETISIPSGLGKITVIKKKRRKVYDRKGKEIINLPIDWKKTKEKGKVIYIMNYHTEGYYFGWKWFGDLARFKYCNFFRFVPTRKASRMIAEYIKKDDKYQHIYLNWIK